MINFSGFGQPAQRRHGLQRRRLHPPIPVALQGLLDRRQKGGIIEPFQARQHIEPHRRAGVVKQGRQHFAQGGAVGRFQHAQRIENRAGLGIGQMLPQGIQTGAIRLESAVALNQPAAQRLLHPLPIKPPHTGGDKEPDDHQRQQHQCQLQGGEGQHVVEIEEEETRHAPNHRRKDAVQNGLRLGAHRLRQGLVEQIARRIVKLIGYPAGKIHANRQPEDKRRLGRDQPRQHKRKGYRQQRNRGENNDGLNAKAPQQRAGKKELAEKVNAADNGGEGAQKSR